MNCEVTGKVRYGTIKLAWKHGEYLSQKTGHPVRAYKCEFCGAYHLTTHKWKNIKLDSKPPLA